MLEVKHISVVEYFTLHTNYMMSTYWNLVFQDVIHKLLISTPTGKEVSSMTYPIRLNS